MFQEVKKAFMLVRLLLEGERTSHKESPHAPFCNAEPSTDLVVTQMNALAFQTTHVNIEEVDFELSLRHVGKVATKEALS